MEANYPESKFGYDKSKPESKLVMFDACSLYGTPMLEKLQNSCYEWVPAEVFRRLAVPALGEDPI